MLFVTFWLFSILFFIITFIIAQYVKKSRMYSRGLHTIYGPYEYPLIGNAYIALSGNPVATFMKAMKIYSSPLKLVVGPIITVFLDKPEHIKKMFASPFCLEKCDLYDVMVFGNGLFTSNYHKWKPHRKYLTTVFSSAALNKLFPVFNKHATKLNAALEEKLNKPEFDILEVIGPCIVNQTGETILGLELPVDELKPIFMESEKTFRRAGTQMLGYKLYGVIFMLQKLIAKWNEAQLNIFAKTIKRSLETREAWLLNNKIENNNIDSEYINRLNSDQLFIDRVLEMKSDPKMINVDPIDHVSIMMMAGIDTSANNLSTALLLLAMHPEVQEKCYQEIKSVLGDNDVDPNLLVEMPYLNMTFKECMRLIPTVPFVARVTKGDIELDESTIPSGNDVVVSLLTLHQNKEIWGENAEKFDPDHFLPENENHRHKFAYIPFSYGQRSCIGAKYATLSLRVMMAHLLRKYRFSTRLKLEELTFTFGITLQIDNKHIITVERR